MPKVTHSNLRGSIAWSITSPLRLLLRNWPLGRGRYRLGRSLIWPLYSKGGTISVHFSETAVLNLEYREALAQQIVYFGSFERAELKCLASSVGATIDVGANVGYVSAFTATARPGDRVIAIEPVPANFSRLKDITASLGNVSPIQIAVGDQPGTLGMTVSRDGAYAAVVDEEESDMKVDVETLDAVWERVGSPKVGAIKVDVEGYEATVLRGAGAILRSHYPMLLVEAWDSAALEGILVAVEPYGYKATQPRGFEPHNYLLLASG